MSALQPDQTKNSAVDDAIECVEKSLPRLRSICKARKKQKKSPIDKLSKQKGAQAQAQFEALSEDPVIAELASNNGGTSGHDHVASGNGSGRLAAGDE